jgi:MFS family permease
MQPPGSPAKAWLMVTLCAVMMGLNYADKGILGFAAQPIMRDFKLSPVEFGYLGSSFFLLFAVSGIVLGFLADRWPSKHVMTAMAIGWALCLLPAAGQVGFVGTHGDPHSPRGHAGTRDGRHPSFSFQVVPSESDSKEMSAKSRVLMCAGTET